MPPRDDAGEDVLVWGETSHGTFTVKSAYFMIEKPNQQLFNPVYKAIWNWKGAEKIRGFLWLAFQNRLPTNELRSKWTLSLADCLHCKQGVENQLHIFRDCGYARNIWLGLIKQRYISSFFSLPLSEWMVLNLSEEVGVAPVSSWSQMWGISVWLLWNWRNKATFQEEFHKPRNPISVIKSMWISFCPDLMSDEITVGGEEASVEHQGWDPPPMGWVKLSVDGAVSQSSQRA